MSSKCLTKTNAQCRTNARETVTRLQTKMWGGNGLVHLSLLVITRALAYKLGDSLSMYGISFLCIFLFFSFFWFFSLLCVNESLYVALVVWCTILSQAQMHDASQASKGHSHGMDTHKGRSGVNKVSASYTSRWTTWGSTTWWTRRWTCGRWLGKCLSVAVSKSAE